MGGRVGVWACRCDVWVCANWRVGVGESVHMHVHVALVVRCEFAVTLCTVEITVMFRVHAGQAVDIAAMSFAHRICVRIAL